MHKLIFLQETVLHSCMTPVCEKQRSSMMLWSCGWRINKLSDFQMEFCFQFPTKSQCNLKPWSLSFTGLNHVVLSVTMLMKSPLTLTKLSLYQKHKFSLISTKFCFCLSQTEPLNCVRSERFYFSCQTT